MTFAQIFPKLMDGFGMTIGLFFLTLAISIPLGLALSFCAMSKWKPLKMLTKGIIWVVRSIPLMLIVFIIFYGFSFWDGTSDSRFFAAAVAFIINHTCYFAEVFRGGIEGIPKGQYDAAKSIGMKKHQIFFRIIMYQVIKQILPPLGNQVVTLVKDTSIAKVISVVEIIGAAEEIMSVYAVFIPLIYAGVFYLIFNSLISLLFGFFEKKMGKYKN